MVGLVDPILSHACYRFFFFSFIVFVIEDNSFLISSQSTKMLLYCSCDM